MSEKTLWATTERNTNLEQMRRLREAGQSAWLDYISACLIQDGRLVRLVESGAITGVTSNPTIFAKSVGSGECGYEQAIRSLRGKDTSTFDVYDEITRRDIAAAADVLRPVYERTGGEDGYVSLEVSPELAREEDDTVIEALRLFRTLGKPNVMIKVPATEEGTAAFRRLTAMGVNVNVTLIFSPSVYERVAMAYVKGLRERAAGGQGVARIASVASFFVSRVDTAVDKRLDALRASGALSAEHHALLRGQAAVGNAKVAYQTFQRIFRGVEFEDLAARGARPQRVLWASTSAKDPSYSDLKYVEPLIGPATVNTMPSETLAAFLDHGKVNPRALEQGAREARELFPRIAALGIDFEQVCAELLEKGVQAFAQSFHELLDTIGKVV